MKKLIGLTALCLLCGSGWAQMNDHSVLLIVGKDTTTRGEFVKLHDKNTQQTKVDDFSQSVRDYLQMYVNFRLKVQSAVDAGYDTNAELQKELYSYRVQAAEPYMRDSKLAESLVQEAYNHMKYDVRARHILIALPRNPQAEDTLKAYKKALEVRSALLKGTPFEVVYDKYSDDPGQKRRLPGLYVGSGKGDLGYFTAFNMVYPFEKAAYDLPPNEYSMPVRTRFGYHIIQVLDKKPALGKILASHIMVMETSADSTRGAKAAVKDKIDEAYDLLQKGEPFESVAKRYSEDKTTVDQGGMLAEFTVEKMSPEVIETFYKMELEAFSRPIKTQWGWHIVRLLNKSGVAGLEQARGDIEYKIGKDERASLPIVSFSEKLLKENDLKEFPEVLIAFRKMVADSVKKASFLMDPTHKMYSKALFVYGGKNVLVKEFAEYIQMKQRASTEDKNEIVNRLYERFKVSYSLLDEIAHLDQKYPEFGELMREYKDGVYLFDRMNQEVWTKASVDTVGLERFFESRRGQYTWPKKVEAVMMTYDVRTLATEKVKKWIEKAYTVEKTVDQLRGEANKKFGENKVVVSEGVYAPGDNVFIDRVEWKEGLSSDIMSGETQKAFVIIRQIIPEKAKRLEDVRGQVITDYQEYLDGEWLKKLKAKYPIVINEEVLKSLEKK